MNELPLVTIGITCFNCEKTIERAFNSAIYQDWINKEIILVDDCSIDESKKILLKLKNQYPKIQVIFNSQNKGLAYCENLIIKKSKGEFLAFFDGDDESQLNRISKQFKKFLEYKNKQLDGKIFVFSNRKVIPIKDFENNSTSFGIGRISPEPYGKLVADYLLKVKRKSDNFCWGVLGSGTMFAKTSCLKNLNGFDENFKRGAELDFWIRSAIKGYHFISVNESLMTQYITGGTHKTLEKDLISRKQLIKKHRNYLLKNFLYTTSLLNFYAWYWYQKKNNFFGHFFRFFAICFSLINKVRSLLIM